jgi:propanediol dehydratase large subunit
MGLRKSKVSIDQRNLHKMVMQFWSKSDKYDSQSSSNPKYENFYIGSEKKSKHFGFVYNGYLKNFKRP